MDKVNILLIDDSLDDIENFQRSLATVTESSVREHVLFIASSMATALEILESTSINIIFLDLLLNGEQNYIPRLEEFSSKVKPPIVILTGLSHETVSKDIYRNCEPIAVTSKPMPVLQLKSLLRLV